MSQFKIDLNQSEFPASIEASIRKDKTVQSRIYAPVPIRETVEQIHNRLSPKELIEMRELVLKESSK